MVRDRRRRDGHELLLTQAAVTDEQVAAGDLARASLEAAGPLLREARPFDVFRGPQLGAGRKSVAIRLVFQAADRTLTDEDESKFLGKVRENAAQIGAELRG